MIRRYALALSASVMLAGAAAPVVASQHATTQGSVESLHQAVDAPSRSGYIVASS